MDNNVWNIELFMFQRFGSRTDVIFAQPHFKDGIDILYKGEAAINEIY